MRKLPAPTAAPAASAALIPPATATASHPEAVIAPPPSLRPAAVRPVVQATAPQRYRVQFTIGEETHARPRRVQALLRREIPDGDPGAIFDRALKLLEAQIEKTKLGAVVRPRRQGGIRPGTDKKEACKSALSSRHIPAEVKRAVSQRDGDQCAFVSGGGRRCTERTFLEFHHVQPYAHGGAATEANISLRCRRRPGHGGTGKVGGSSGNNATSPSGLLEKDLTLAVARHAEAGARQPAATPCGSPAPQTSTCRSWTAPRWRSPQERTPSSRYTSTVSATPSVQGTETWVHQNGSAQSVELASCVQRSGPAKPPATTIVACGARCSASSTPSIMRTATAACLAELSFITTTAEDVRLHDPEYLKALGEAVAKGVQEFVGQQDVQLQTAEATGVERTIATAGRPAAFRTPVTFSASTTVSPTAEAVATMRPPLTDVRQAIDALPKKGRKTKYAGPVASGGEARAIAHPGTGGLQGRLPPHAQRRGREVGTHPGAGPRRRTRSSPSSGCPPSVPSGPSFFHAGGCQLIGDVLAVPSESGRNASVIAFFDVSDPMHIREFNGALRIARDSRDAAAVGITTYERNGQTVWLLAVYDSGTVDFYESPDFTGGALFEPRFQCRVDEKDHQHLLLFTDQANRVFAVGLNRGNFPFFDRLMVYAVDLAGTTMKADPDRDISTGGGTRLRWGASLEVGGRSTGAALHGARLRRQLHDQHVRRRRHRRAA